MVYPKPRMGFSSNFVSRKVDSRSSMHHDLAGHLRVDGTIVGIRSRLGECVGESFVRVSYFRLENTVSAHHSVGNVITVDPQDRRPDRNVEFLRAKTAFAMVRFPLQARFFCRGLLDAYFALLREGGINDRQRVLTANVIHVGDSEDGPQLPLGERSCRDDDVLVSLTCHASPEIPHCRSN